MSEPDQHVVIPSGGVSTTRSFCKLSTNKANRHEQTTLSNQSPQHGQKSWRLCTADCAWRSLASFVYLSCRHHPGPLTCDAISLTLEQEPLTTCSGDDACLLVISIQNSTKTVAKLVTLLAEPGVVGHPFGSSTRQADAG